MTMHDPATLRSHWPASDPIADARACRRLWAAVLHQQVEIALKAPDWRDPRFRDARQVTAARDWFRSRHFLRVCDLAGIDPDFVLRGMRRALWPEFPGDPKGKGTEGGAR